MRYGVELSRVPGYLVPSTIQTVPQQRQYDDNNNNNNNNNNREGGKVCGGKIPPKHFLIIQTKRLLFGVVGMRDGWLGGSQMLCFGHHTSSSDGHLTVASSDLTRVMKTPLSTFQLAH